MEEYALLSVFVAVSIAAIVGAEGSGSGSLNPLADLDFLDLSETCRTFLPQIDDGHSRAINIPGGFPFGNSTQHVAYVSTNGYVSFGRAATDFQHRQEICNYILAPFWADFDIRCGGEVVYTSINRSSDNWMLDRVSTFINGNAVKFADFRGTWMLVVQWNEVPLYTQPPQLCSSQHQHTIQAIAITDGQQSFAVFTYKCGFLEQSWNATIGMFGGQGFNSLSPYEVKDIHIACSSQRTNYSIVRQLHFLRQYQHAEYEPASVCRAGCCDLNVCDKYDSTQPMLSSCACDAPMDANCITEVEKECSVDQFYQTFFELNTTSSVTLEVLTGETTDAIAIDLEEGFPFDDARKHSVYVGRKGYISFGRTIENAEPNLFPHGPVYVLAPYWTQISTGPLGRVVYEVHTSTPDNLDAILDEVSALVTEKTGTSFTARWMVVALWENVSPGPPELSQLNLLFAQRLNTFQAAVVTDGCSSFAVFIYHCCLMEWSGEKVEIGFNGDGLHLFRNHPLSMGVDTAAVACLNKPVSDWTTLIYELTNYTAVTDSEETESRPKGLIGGIYGGCGFLVLVLLAVAIGVFACYRIHTKTKLANALDNRRDLKLENEFEMKFDLLPTSPTSPDSASGLVVNSLMSPTLAMGNITFLLAKWNEQFGKHTISSMQVELSYCLGEGAFGKVYKGKMKTSTGSDSEHETVAVKFLKKVSSLDEIQEFVAESAIMLDFDHPNVLHLIGICLDTDDHLPWIILPFMANGDLKSFLVSKRSSTKGSVSEDLDFPEELNHEILVQMCLDVARGMEYLASKRFVHRDVAARNCMVDSNLLVKVADFGLSRDLYKSEYYRLTHKSLLPIKWMSPESLLDNIYNEKTDVWSFGVTCWEVFNLGRTPYPGVVNAEIPEYICAGHRLRKPSLCTVKMYNIMFSCWTENFDERPTFTEIVVKIEALRQSDLGSFGHDYAILEAIREEGEEDNVFEESSQQHET